jgi:Ca-activated chloride channel family protein
MTFAAPQWLWLALLAPLAATVASWLWRRRRAAALAWASRGLWDRLLPGWSRRRLLATTTLLAVAVLGAGLALARPRWGEGKQTVERHGIDIVFVLDTSLSMAAHDVKPSRFWVAQSLVRRLVADLPGNRVALVQAEGEGVAMSPLTLDAAVLDLLLDAAAPGSLPTPGTEIAPALDTAIALFPADGKKHRAIVLLSDGEDHGGHLDKALAKLADEHVTVFAIGVGSPEGAPLPLPGDARDYKRDSDGKVVVSRLEEKGLETFARETGGAYLRATDAAVDLAPVVSGLRAIDGRTLASDTISTAEERFQWPLLLAIVALFAQLLIGPFRPEARAS